MTLQFSGFRSTRNPNPVALGALLFLALLSMTPISNAQDGWQAVYGERTRWEDGFRGVTPVLGSCSRSPACAACSTQTDGYIAVGSSLDIGAPDNDVYVVRVDNSGTAIWEQTYDISGSQSIDVGNSIVELSDGSGFAVVGNTDNDIFVMKIDCDGAVVWIQTFIGPGPSSRAVGEDILETRTGTLPTTRPGDLVVAGYVATPFNGYDALLLRLSRNGGLIWHRRYGELSSSNEYLHAVIEATAVGSATGDIIATGYYNSSGDDQGYVVRVNGNTGRFGAAPQGTGLYGSGSDWERFTALTELGNQSDQNGRPHVVLAGMGASGTEIFLTKLSGGNPCSTLVQTLVGDGGQAVDVAWDIQQVRIPFGGSGGGTGGGNPIQQWDLILTGATESYGMGGANDAFLLGIDPNSLCALTGGGMLYHPNGSDFEDRGWSLAIVDEIGDREQGVIMCGSTRSDWLRENDPQDMYLLKTDVALSTDRDCEDPYEPDCDEVDYATCGDPSDNPAVTVNNSTPNDTPRDWGYLVCTDNNNSGKAVPGFDSETELASYSLEASPNPLTVGSPLSFRFTGQGLPDKVIIGVTNSLGASMIDKHSVPLDASGAIIVETSGWPAGVCFVTIEGDGYTRMIRVVVVE